MKKKICIIAFLSGCMVAGNSQYGMAFKGMGGTAGSSHEMSSAGQNKSSRKNMIIEGHEGNRETVIAMVNDAPVTMGALVDSIRETMMTKYGKTEVTKDIARSIRQDAFEKLVLEELACQRAVNLGISVQPERIEKIVEARRVAAGGEEALQKILTQQNTTLQAFERQTERIFLIKQLINRDIDSKITISEEKLNRAYMSSKERFAEPERVKISDIIFFLDPDDPLSKQKVLDIRTKIIDELSGKPASLKETGLLVKSHLNVTETYEPLLYKYGRRMKPGSFSDPLLIDGTFHLIKLESYHPYKEQPKEQIVAYIASQMKASEKSQRLPLWRHELLKNGKVEIIHEILK